VPLKSRIAGGPEDIAADYCCHSKRGTPHCSR